MTQNTIDTGYQRVGIFWKLGIFWDFEVRLHIRSLIGFIEILTCKFQNCSVPRGMSGTEVASKIGDAFCEFGQVVLFKVLLNEYFCYRLLLHSLTTYPSASPTLRNRAKISPNAFSICKASCRRPVFR